MGNDPVIMLKNFTRDEMKEIVQFVNSLRPNEFVLCIHPLNKDWHVDSPVEEVCVEDGELIFASEHQKN